MITVVLFIMFTLQIRCSVCDSPLINVMFMVGNSYFIAISKLTGSIFGCRQASSLFLSSNKDTEYDKSIFIYTI